MSSFSGVQVMNSLRFSYLYSLMLDLDSLTTHQNIMTDSVMTASPGKSGIRHKRQIWTWAGMRTRIAQVAERRARNPEVRIPVLVQIFLLRSDNVNFPRHKLWVCFHLMLIFLSILILQLYRDREALIIMNMTPKSFRWILK